MLGHIIYKPLRQFDFHILLQLAVLIIVNIIFGIC